MTNLIHDDGFAPYFERSEKRLHKETHSAPPGVPPEQHRPQKLFALDPRTITSSGPAWRDVDDASDRAA